MQTTAINAIDPDGIFWQTSDSGDPSPPADSPPNAAWVNDPDTISDKYLDSPSGTIDPNESLSVLTFWHNYALEDGFDGGVLEISLDGGPFQDILAVSQFEQGGYNGTISTCCGNPLAGRQAWTGNSVGFIQTIVDVPRGHTIAVRWRMASDSSGSGEGWRVDSIDITCERPTPSPTPFPTPSITPTVTPNSQCYAESYTKAPSDAALSPDSTPVKRVIIVAMIALLCIAAASPGSHFRLALRVPGLPRQKSVGCQDRFIACPAVGILKRDMNVTICFHFCINDAANESVPFLL